MLGQWAAVCVECGAARRWFEELESELPERCAQCGGRILHRCPSCNAPFSSAFAVDCESCGEPLRAGQLFGTPIRKDQRS